MKLPPKRLTHKQVKQRKRDMDTKKLAAAVQDMLNSMTPEQRDAYFKRVFSNLEH